MKLICPKCAAEIPPKNVNISEGFAQCAACNEYFRIAEHLGSDETIRRTQKPLLSKITLHEAGDSYIFHLPPMRWKRATPIFLLMTLIWNYFSVYAVILSFQKIPKYMLLISFAIGLLLIYTFIKKFFEATTVTYSPSEINLFKSIGKYTYGKKSSKQRIVKFTEVVTHEENYKPVYGIAIVFTTGSTIEFGSYTIEGERKWIIGELYEIKKKFDAQKLVPRP
jgi:hypothetical protein